MMMKCPLRRAAVRGLSAARRHASSVAALVASHPAHADALLAPQQDISWTCESLLATRTNPERTF